MAEDNLSEWKTVEVPSHYRPGCSWVEVLVEIRLNATGEVRQAVCNELLTDGEPHPSVFDWSDNNYNCNCNREAFFMSAGGSASDNLSGECGEGRFAVRLSNSRNKQVYYSEWT